MLRKLPVLALLLVLTGCGGGEPPVPTPTPAATAVFASEEEALAAAVAVFADLAALMDDIAVSGGEGTDRLQAYATGDFLEGTKAGFDDYPARRVHQVGYSTFRDTKLQQFSSGPGGAVSMYVCLDLTAVDIVDVDGRSVVESDRPDTLHLIVTYDLGDDGLLRVSKWERWDELQC